RFRLPPADTVGGEREKKRRKNEFDLTTHCFKMSTIKNTILRLSTIEYFFACVNRNMEDLDLSFLKQLGCDPALDESTTIWRYLP
ncbi:MAG: hypothetical protein ABI177_07915, partial [Edaphobacter sp.]